MRPRDRLTLLSLQDAQIVVIVVVEVQLRVCVARARGDHSEDRAGGASINVANVENLAVWRHFDHDVPTVTITGVADHEMPIRQERRADRTIKRSTREDQARPNRRRTFKRFPPARR